ncbi:Hypothetical_protein [Hexamita inflata]|uniref:Hypothetical_protein n=1 Tax=Hexamita inflata TaxID=28002 RepID=A0AA86RA67_9EUKA|nr:Hypothetical protein HINF_LOCUS56842 [Hexamita inflata]
MALRHFFYNSYMVACSTDGLLTCITHNNGKQQQVAKSTRLNRTLMEISGNVTKVIFGVLASGMANKFACRKGIRTGFKASLSNSTRMVGVGVFMNTAAGRVAALIFDNVIALNALWSCYSSILHILASVSESQTTVKYRPH